MYVVNLTEDAKDDYAKLDGSQQTFILKGLKRIEQRGINAGEMLKGSLAGCRKLTFRDAGLRIVFRQNGDKVEVINVVAIGKRDNSKVYKDALKRLKE
ncbi:type II toxin-antitoxin system RelE family toxin [Salinicoccus albus]|uniref:type II toxin-antitoxin system RelE family toxin n=1 Tax=Salinicoccus albus TaxID=418756 RepID=UPI00037C6FBB|nr:hypothetical protein [Salinicoccus albus]